MSKQHEILGKYFEEYYLSIANFIGASEESKKFIRENIDSLYKGTTEVPWSAAEKKKAVELWILI